MSKVAIMTDSNSGITQAEAASYGVVVLPMPFYINGEMLYEEIDLTQEQFYQKLTEGGEIKTSMPLVGDVTDKWDELLQTYDEIVYIPMSSGLSADVPYCLMRGTALAQGIGEKLSQLPPMVKCPVLIAKPAVSVSTKFVYQNLKLDEHTIHPDIDALIGAIRNKDFTAICGNMGNVLESVTIPNYPVIAQIKEKMMEAGASHAMMSGSGPTVFGLFEDEEIARHARDVMKESGLARQVYLTSIYNNRRK